jgi:hypothetical protein
MLRIIMIMEPTALYSESPATGEKDTGGNMPLSSSRL